MVDDFFGVFVFDLGGVDESVFCEMVLGMIEVELEGFQTSFNDFMCERDKVILYFEVIREFKVGGNVLLEVCLGDLLFVVEVFVGLNVFD